MLKLLLILFVCTSMQFSTTAEQTKQNSYIHENGQELLLCRKCGVDVADSHYLTSKYSPGALKVEKQNLFGQNNVTILTLVNPFNVKFDIITTEKARCKNLGSNQPADSWFPGYTWRICTCPHCGQHLGWTFENSSSKPPDNNNTDSFHGLILHNILGENFTDSLMLLPKSYQM